MATRHIPDFRTPASTGQTLSWESFAGKVPVLLVCMPDGVDAETLQGFDRLHSRFGDHRIQLLAVAPITARQARETAEAENLTTPILSDPSSAILAGIGTGPSAVLYDRDGREVCSYDLTEAAITPDAVMQDISSMVTDGSLEIMEGDRS
jgi:peroxiredoxin